MKHRKFAEERRRFPVVTSMLTAAILSACSPDGAGKATVPTKDATLADVRAALAAGDPDKADAIFHKPFGYNVPTDPDLSSVLADVNAALEEKMAPRKAADFAERVDTYYLPDLEVLPPEPESPAAFWRITDAFESAARDLEAAGEPANEEQKAAFAKLRRALIAKQQAMFPKMRRNYVAQLKEPMWRLNVDVATGGKTARAIKMTGVMFADNGSIASVQEGAAKDLSKLRFATAEYRWTPSAGGYVYTLKSPADQQLGYWEDAYFHEVK